MLTGIKCITVIVIAAMKHFLKGYENGHWKFVEECSYYIYITKLEKAHPHPSRLRGRGVEVYVVHFLIDYFDVVFNTVILLSALT